MPDEDVQTEDVTTAIKERFEDVVNVLLEYLWDKESDVTPERKAELLASLMSGEPYTIDES